MQEMNLIPLAIPDQPETRRAAALPAQNSRDIAPIFGGLNARRFGRKGLWQKVTDVFGKSTLKLITE